jgi:hypothetical protein
MLEGATVSRWYQSTERFFGFCSREREFTMPPRRDRQSPDLEDREMLRRRGRQMTDPFIERQMRDIQSRLEDMETA